MGGGGESSRSHGPRPSTRGLGLKNSSGGGGEIVEVQGGHIMRSIGRKDRHSKVCTAKGPRDRRVRLAAHTAIQFYDVQDRLGYDRPSKAVDWLIKKAKAAIDELDQLPSWHPTTSLVVQEQGDEAAQKKLGEDENRNEEEQHHHESYQARDLAASSVSGKGAAAMTMLGGEHEHQRLNQHRENLNNASFLPPSLDSDSIADTIKSFFPMGGASAESGSTSSMQFQRFSIPDLLPRTSTNHSHGQSQDLRLSLQSFQDPILLQQAAHHHHHQNHHNLPTSQVLLSGTPIGSFDAAATLWPDHNHNSSELNRFQKLQSWNNVGGGDGNASEIGLYNPTQSMVSYHHHHHNQLFPQRGPLQSSNMPSFRAWMDYPSISSADYNHQQQSHYTYPATSVSGMGYHQPGVGGFSGFHVPARIQGDEEEHDGYSDKPSSASSDSRH